MEQEMENVEETQQVEQTTQEVDESKFKSAGNDDVIKVDLSKPITQEEDAVTEQSTDEVPVRDESETSEEVREENVEAAVEKVTGEEERVQDDQPTLEEVTEEVEELEEKVEEAIVEAQATGKPLPENIQKLVDFVEDTGGSLEDYVMLNQDYSKMDNLTALQEYYRLTKPHLDAEERSFLMEENFSFDEELDDEKDIRRKKIALKEQVAEAKAYLDGQKSKYYDEIKAGSKLTEEQQKAINFFNRYNKESEETQAKAEAAKSIFDKKTENLFNDKFKGFEYEVGDKKYRFNVNNAEKVKQTQSDINNFIGKFLNEDGTINNAKDYHKSLYTAMNADAIAKHFYEQGKADALKDSVAKAKNVDMKPNQVHSDNVDTGGLKFKVLGQDSKSFKIRKRN
jgi:hypothetical protein